ncbi:hypothetical protein FS827_28750 [Agrobacterium vitis]|uniref:hypothetical protein n=1 Tax=Rhizobium/Agrobacterium group TaxID=227290 RepID=UPI0012E8A238|nr:MULTISPECIES: hypothetical protein [Rhizobium/Agrobacterium group]MCF1465202.1 hypothetical protein [Allorhizobium ampelinum]MVA54460.1 hypothetical protein [Agrobacterium vitis]
MRSIVQTFCTAALLSCAVHQAGAEDEIRKRLASPFGISDARGVDAIGETLISSRDRAELGYWFYQQDTLAAVSNAQESQNSTIYLGYGVKGIGRAVGAGGGAFGGGFGPAIGGAATIGGAVVGGYVEDYGDKLIRQGGQLAAAAVTNYLHKEYGRIIRPNGTIDQERLRSFGEENFARMLRDPRFIEQVGDSALMADFKAQITLDQLGVVLKDNKSLLLSSEKTGRQLTELDKGYREVKSLQLKTLGRLDAQGQVLGSIEGKLDRQTLIVSTIATSKLPPRQILALSQAGAFTLDAPVVQALETAASAQELQADFNKAAGVFRDMSTALDVLGVDPEFTRATNGIGNVLSAGGGLAAAITLGEPFSIFSSGAAFLGSVKSLFGGKQEDPTQAALRNVFREIQRLSQQIERNHRQQMEALRRIAEKLESLEDTVNRRFAELELDVAYILQDTRELLYEDVRVCERLVEEFRLAENQALLARGLLGFSLFFETDNRALDYARCMNGLIARQRVISERDFSGMLRADSVEEADTGAHGGKRREAVRRIEQRVLQPTVDYIRLMADGDNAEVVARKLFRPVATLCQALSYHDPEAASCEGAPPSSWPDSRIDRSQYNPGQGALLSPTTAVLLSGFTRAVAPWNGILIERTTGAAARVMSEDEVASVSRRSASRRTRHVLALANATDVLDLNIAQANLLAGVPVIHKASDILDKKIIPAYAQARLMKTPAAINQMLAAPPPNRALPGPNCVAGSEEWNTLCLMEASPTFAKNVVRALVLKRLKARGATINEWRQAIRSPFSDRMREIIGHDVLFEDAAAGLPTSTLGMWAIELPRVYSDPDLEPSAIASAKLCWNPTAVEPLTDDQGKPSKDNPYYTTPASSRCNMIDPFTSSDMLSVAHYTQGYAALLTERELSVGLLRGLCDANPFYPTRYCAFGKPLSEATASRDSD